jgi:hypothetical protein
MNVVFPLKMKLSSKLNGINNNVYLNTVATYESAVFPKNVFMSNSFIECRFIASSLVSVNY